jgi:glucose-1-phosphate cytidylyltransferase
MKVVILAGGLGTRLREETEFRPKPMVEIGGRPILWHIMKHYSVFGFHDFIICLGYKGDMIRSYFLNYKLMNTDFTVELGTGKVAPVEILHDEADWRVILAETGLTTGTGGRIKRIAKYIPDDTFLATYGDSLSDVPIDKVIAYHREMNLVATMCVMRTSQRFGVVSVADGIVTKFEEKPRANRDWINGGFYVFSRKIFDYLDEDCKFEQEPLARLVADGQLTAYQHEGCHRAMDTLRDVQALNAEWESRKTPWRTWLK